MSNINPRHLMTAQEVVASTLSGTDVSVVFDADAPWADLTNRVIHLRPVPDRLSDEAVEDVRGDCDHELGHIIHTDPDELDRVKRKLVRKIADALEDGRVERLVASEWMGCGENLERSARRAIDRIAAERSDDEVNRRARALCGLSLLSYGWSIEDVVGALGDDIEPYYDKIRYFAHGLPLLKTTHDVVNGATCIADEWKWGPIEDANVKSDRALENAAAKELEKFDLSSAEARKRAVQAIGDGKATGSYRPKTDEDKTELIRRPSFEVGNLYGMFFDGVRKTAPILRRRLMMQFRSTGYQYRSFQKKGSIDDRNLWRYGLGDDRIYRRRVPNRSNRSTVTILVDCSASMTKAAREPKTEGEPIVLRTRLFIAAQAAAAVSATLDSLNVPNEVLAFTTSRRNPKPDPKFERVRALRHLIVKPYNRPFRSCRGNFLSLAFYEHCSENIDGEALLWAGRRMLSKPNHGDQPVLIVFSDGEPKSRPESDKVLVNHLMDSIRRVEASGITIFGIGVGTDSVNRFYRNALVVYDVSNLLSSFYELIKKILSEREVRRV